VKEIHGYDANLGLKLISPAKLAASAKKHAAAVAVSGAGTVGTA